MASAKSIVGKLVDRGIIPAEFEEVAVLELHRELTRRVRRTAHTLACLTADHQLGVRAASIFSRAG